MLWDAELYSSLPSHHYCFYACRAGGSTCPQGGWEGLHIPTARRMPGTPSQGGLPPILVAAYHGMLRPHLSPRAGRPTCRLPLPTAPPCHCYLLPARYATLHRHTCPADWDVDAPQEHLYATRITQFINCSSFGSPAFWLAVCTGGGREEAASRYGT